MDSKTVLEDVCREKHKRVEGDTCRIEKRVDRHGEEIDALKEIMAVVASTQDRLTKIVDEMQAKPGKRWDAVVSQVIMIVIAAALGGVIGWLF